MTAAAERGTAQHRSGRIAWPWSRGIGFYSGRGTHDSGTDVSGTSTGQQEGPAAFAQPSPGRSWPIDASPADVEAARRWLAEYPDRVPASLPPPPYPHPSIGPLLELVVGGQRAAAVLASALAHAEDLVDYWTERDGYE